MEEPLIQKRSRQNWIIALVSVSVFMFSVDYSMLNISLPTITGFFKANIDSVSRLPLAYLLVVTSTALLFGKLGDIIGFKKIFIAGLIVFMIGTFLCGIAPTLNTLLIFRVFQCLGEAMFSPIGIAIVTTCLPRSIQGKALGIMATANGLGFSLGPVLGGYINSHMGWHGIFFVNIPIGICLAITALKVLPSKIEEPSREKIDYIGAVLIFISLGPLIYALNSAGKLGLNNPVIISCLAIFIAALIVFIMREKSAKYPILDTALFKNPDFTFASLAGFTAVFVYMGLLFLFPFYLNMVKGLDALHSGLFLMLPAVMLMISAPLAGKISDKIGSRGICSLGMAMTGLAFFIFSRFKPESSILFMLPALLIAGVAVGCFLPANNKLIMIHAPADKQGMASAVYKIVNSMGGVFGIAVMPLVLMKTVYAKAALIHMNLRDIKHSPEVLSAGFDAAFRFGIFVCIMGFIFALLAKDKKI
ncbi:MAG: DHA2 family efflux MFS transporter permease subunit [Candidatus Omnitrophota bacterium]|nr:DHA2 family efflux MFS transporter permease subunit [Candidatus Omnitrophota bacterium]